SGGGGGTTCGELVPGGGATPPPPPPMPEGSSISSMRAHSPWARVSSSTSHDQPFRLRSRGNLFGGRAVPWLSPCAPERREWTDARVQPIDRDEPPGRLA